MAIESVTHPADLTRWDPDQQPYYLELFGETSPRIDVHYAEAFSPSYDDESLPVEKSAPIYEYFWTIGHPGLPTHEEGVVRFLHLEKDGAGRAEKLWGHLNDDPAARVYLFFPLGGGWRIKELVATVKYLKPVREEHTLMEEAAKDWEQLQPVVAGASQIAGMAAPAVGPVGLGAASALSAIARLKVNSVPRAKGFEWSAGKVTCPTEAGPLQGVMWELPRKLFAMVGGRISGSVAVSFIPDRRQAEGTVVEELPSPHQLDLRCHAVVYGAGKDIWAPDKSEYLRLAVAPRLPEARRAVRI